MPTPRNTNPIHKKRDTRLLVAACKTSSLINENASNESQDQLAAYAKQMAGRLTNTPLPNPLLCHHGRFPSVYLP